MSHSLTIYIYPSPNGVDWKSPLHLTRSVVRNFATRKPRTIGHVTVELSGPDHDSTREDLGFPLFTGMTTKQFNLNKRLLLWERLGLGVLWHQYQGHLERPHELIPERNQRLQQGNFSFVKFEISEESFARAKAFLKEFHEQELFRWYGLPNRPRYREGAGCSAFVAGILETAGLLDDELRSNWSGRVRAPESLVGSPERNGRKVGVWKLLLENSVNQRWALPEEPGKEVFFWDPDMMHRWVMRQWSAPEGSSIFQRTQVHLTKGIMIDARERVPGKDSIWL